MAEGRIVKSPDAIIDVGFSWNAAPPAGPYLDANDAIATSSWSVTDPPNDPLDPN